jgi:endonuclease/exonuclease/phosphatase family metal-dependent hydrolase
MRFVSFNIHRAVGSRGRPSIRAVGEVLRQLEPDVVALNEIVRTPVLADQPKRLASMLGMSHAFDRTTRRQGMSYGNAVLIRGRILEQQHTSLPAEGVEPRGALFVDAEVDGAWFTFGCTHLEPRPTARALQLEALAVLLPEARGSCAPREREAEAATPGQPLPAGARSEYATAPSTDGCPFVLAGDLNAAPGELTALLDGAGLNLAPPHATFPASAPLAAIDHVLFSRHWKVIGSFAVAAPVSDHAALVVDLERVG